MIDWKNDILDLLKEDRILAFNDGVVTILYREILNNGNYFYTAESGINEDITEYTHFAKINEPIEL